MPGSRLIFVSGKGGTGKSAVAAAIAIDRARRGESVLAVDMGTSLGLGSHLRHPGLVYRPTETRPGLFAMSMDRARALDEYLKLQLHVPQGAPTRQIANALSVLADTAPGVREIISIGKPIYEVWQAAWDCVVVDGPSLGQFQSYLRAPVTIAELVPTGNVRRQAQRLAETLHDPSVTSIVLVATPGELAIRETEEALAMVRTERLCPDPEVVLNRVIPAMGIDEAALGAVPEGSIRDAAVMQLAIEDEQARWSGGIPVAGTLPYLRGVLTPEEVALQLADVIDVGVGP